MKNWTEAGVIWLLFLGMGHPACGETAAVRALLLGEARISVEVADSVDARAHGLSGRDWLDPDSGLLFIYPRPKPIQLTMKGTKIPMSVAFLDASGKILNIEDMAPLDEKTLHASKGPALYALGVNRGWFTRHGIRPGLKARFVTVTREIDGVVLRGRRLVVETVQSPDKIERGLMFRDSIPQDHGMLFVFSNPHVLSFWMKNTKIPLSVAFLDENRKILNIRDMEPLDEKTRHRSKGPGLYALEVNRGWFDRNGIKEGDVATFLQRSRERIEAR